MDEALAFLRTFTEAECRAARAKYAEPNDDKFIALVWAADAMFGDGLGVGISRPHGKPASQFANESYIAAAARQRPRPIFAVARCRHDDGGELYRAWLGTGEAELRGEAMEQNVYVMQDAGEFKVVSVYRVCSSCMGGGLERGQPCTTCDATGWLYRRGVEWPALGAPLEVRKLAAPTDARYLPAYQAIPEPEGRP